LGQMNPRLNTSSRSPRIRTTSSPLVVISSPHVASHSGHVRKCVVVSAVSAVSAGVVAGSVTLVPLGGVPRSCHPPPKRRPLRAPAPTSARARPYEGRPEAPGRVGAVTQRAEDPETPTEHVPILDRAGAVGVHCHIVRAAER